MMSNDNEHFYQDLIWFENSFVDHVWSEDISSDLISMWCMFKRKFSHGVPLDLHFDQTEII